MTQRIFVKYLSRCDAARVLSHNGSSQLRNSLPTFEPWSILVFILSSSLKYQPWWLFWLWIPELIWEQWAGDNLLNTLEKTESQVSWWLLQWYDLPDPYRDLCINIPASISVLDTRSFFKDWDSAARKASQDALSILPGTINPSIQVLVLRFQRQSLWGNAGPLHWKKSVVEPPKWHIKLQSLFGLFLTYHNAVDISSTYSSS